MPCLKIILGHIRPHTIPKSTSFFIFLDHRVQPQTRSIPGMTSKLILRKLFAGSIKLIIPSRNIGLELEAFLFTLQHIFLWVDTKMKRKGCLFIKIPRKNR